MNNDGISNEGNRAVDSAVNGAENDPKRPVFLPGAEGPEAKSVKVEPMNTDNNRSSIKESSGSSADQPFKSAGASTTTYTAPTPSEASYKGGSSAALHCGGGTQTSGSEAVGTSAESTNAPATQAVLKQNVPSSQPDTKPRPRGSSDATIEEKKSADPSQNASVSVQEQQPLPNKLLTMAHLQRKYSGELEYMLREFRKLERQLLGAKGATQIEESAGSRERREKLHSFILHLEDTIRQIELGCKLEVEGKTTVNVGVATPDGESKTSDTIKTGLSQEKEEEENVQKLEEHILANLLPVKIRLKKQLAAQQGATRNPAGMPAPRRGYPQPADPDKGKGTFAAAAEQRRKQAEEMAAQQHQISPAEPVDPEQTHFGKPLGRRGSSLTQKLHGQTLGSKARLHGHGVGLAKPAPENDEGKSKIVYCGVAPGSKQVVSGVSAAASTHKMVIETPQLKSQVDSLENSGAPKVVHSSETAQGTGDQSKSEGKMSKKGPTPERAPTFKNHGTKRKFDDPTLTEDARETLRRKLQKKKQIVKAKRRELERQRQAAIQSTQSHGPSQIAGGRKKIVGKGNGKKRGPRSVEYICALCSETYNSVSDYNPWWALAQHSCPKCGKTQIPRIDISAPANAIEYHPALLAHADDNGSGGGNNAASSAVGNNGDAAELKATHVSSPAKYQAPSPHATVAMNAKFSSESDLGSDLSDITDGNLSDISLDSDDSDAEVLATMTPAEKAEHEIFGHDYCGPKLSDSEASRLLILMLHASGCPCRHKNSKHKDVCRSTKYMMLHVRDCPGTTSTFDVCPFPWCRKVKHLLYHLVSCTQPKQCAICSPSNLTKEMQGLVGLNKHRLKRQRERMIAAIRSNNATRQQQRASQYSQVQPAKSSSSLPKKPFPQIGSAPSKPKATTARSTAVTKPRPNVQNLQTNYSLASKPSTAAQVQPSSAGTQKDVSPSASDPAKSNIIAPSTVKIEPQGIAQQNKTPVHVNVAPASVVQNPIPMDGSPEEKSTSKSVGNHGQSSAEIGPEVATKKENTITVSAKNRSTTGGQSTTNTDAITTFEAAPEATKEIRNTHESKVKIETVAGLANESGGTNEATPSLETNQEEDRTQGDGKTGETRQTTLSDTKLDETNFSSAAVKQEEDEIPQRNQSIAAGDAAKDTSNSSVTPSESEICRSDSSSKADQTSHSEKTVTQVRVA